MSIEEKVLYDPINDIYLSKSQAEIAWDIIWDALKKWGVPENYERENFLKNCFISTWTKGSNLCGLCGISAYRQSIQRFKPESSEVNSFVLFFGPPRINRSEPTYLAGISGEINKKILAALLEKET